MPKFRLDARLTWTQTADGWAGTVIPYNEQNRTQREKENELEQRRQNLLEKFIMTEN